MDDLKKEFWGDLQADLFTANTAVYLANQSLEQLISTDGRKAHRPIVSNPQVGTYVPHSDISFAQKTATKQTLEVDTFEYAAEDIDDTESKQTPYDLQSQSMLSIRHGLMNIVEQKFLDEIPNAYHHISNSPVELSGTNILDVIAEADGKLGAWDAPAATSMKAGVFGPRTIAKLRQAKADRESKLGDATLENGVIGPWQGWTFVENNNLPWSATLGLATQPTDGDTITIQGVVFTFKTALGTTPGQVLIGGSAANARTNLQKAVEGLSGAGTSYIELDIFSQFVLRRKRNITCTTVASMAFSGYGDISVSSDLTDGTDGWSNQQQHSVFMIRGAIDLVIQFMNVEIGRKEKGFADLTKGIIGVGTYTFNDGKILMVDLVQDASGF